MLYKAFNNLDAQNRKILLPFDRIFQRIAVFEVVAAVVAVVAKT